MERTVRRLAAVLAADVVGYSGKIEADESSTLAALKDVRATTIDPLLAENSGRIVKTMGDGFIAEFGSVVDAVTFAVAMQRAVPDRQVGTAPEKRLVYRIGINLGDVVVEGDDLLGDGVNVAARLEQICKPGGILISGTAYDQLQGKLGLPLDFTGEQQVKNINRSVRTYAVRLDGSAPGWSRALPRYVKRARPAIAAGLIAIGLAGGAWWYTHRAALSSVPSIAVMPFEVAGGDAATDRLARGIANDISIDFSRIHNLDVIGSSTTEAYGSGGADVRRIARDLNVRYVLTGAIQREGDQFRVSALLQDGGTGASLWSNRWDRPSGDIFAVQNEVSDGVISTLGGRGLLTSLAAVAARRKGPSDLEAYDLFALGLADFYKGGEEGFAESIKLFDAAIAKDPQFGFAYVKKAWAILNYALTTNGDLDEAANEFERLARKAIEIDPYDAEGHVSLGDKLVWWGDVAQGAVEVERALELNPSSADLMLLSAGAMSHLGRPEEGAAQCDKAYRLNSAPPPFYPVFCYENYFFTKRYRESAEATRRHYAWIRPRKEDLTAVVFRAASQIEAGAADDAAATIAEWKQEYPEVPVEAFMSFYIAYSRQQEPEQLVASLQKAGAPMCVPSEKLADFPKLQHLKICDEKRAKQAVR
jgi:class 3 adenylate cyclase/TolB-like protein/tetratricopeptide (TPR) repeat protein